MWGLPGGAPNKRVSDMRKERQQLDGEELETALAFMLDYIRSRPKLEPASRAAGFGSKWIWTALKRSEQGDPRYLVRWPDRDAPEKIQLFEAVNLAVRQWKAKFSTTLMQESEEGVPRLQIHGGQVLYEKDPEALARCGGESPEACDFATLLGYEDYPYRHRTNANGNLERIPLVTYEHVPATLRVHTARSLLPSFNPPETRHQVTSHTGAVMVIARKPYQKDYVPTDLPIRRDLQQRLSELRKTGPKRLPQAAPLTDDAPENVAARLVRRAPVGIGPGTPAPGGFKVR
jgi:hypothetical protein